MENISQYFSFHCIFEQINVSLLSMKDFFQKQPHTFVVLVACFLCVFIFAIFRCKWKLKNKVNIFLARWWSTCTHYSRRSME